LFGDPSARLRVARVAVIGLAPLRDFGRGALDREDGRNVAVLHVPYDHGADNQALTSLSN
jgi:hypothetical protein